MDPKKDVVDHFKDVNNLYSHVFTDDILQLMGSFLIDNIRGEIHAFDGQEHAYKMLYEAKNTEHNKIVVEVIS